ncbi:hypothetical protein BGZ60DRAFT_399238 [Tricladium varicosporioides]|nr:hypothetical protein BGZ60DRAFT_399238 [Hymenoscyphus varicosporioides]
MPKGPGRPVKERHIPQSVVPDTKLHQLFASVRRDRTNFVKKIPVTGKGVPHINVANDIALVGTANLSQQDVPSRAVHAASNGVDLDSQQNMGVQQGQMGFCQPSASPNMAAGGQPRVGNGTVQPSVNAPQEQMCFVQLPDGSVVPAGGQYRPGLYLGQPHMGPPQEKMGPAQPPEHPPMMRGQPCAGNFYNHQYQSTPLPHSFSPTPSGYMPSPMPGKYGYQSMPQQRGYSLAANSNMRPLPAPAQLMPYGTTHQPSSYAQPAGNFSSPFPLPQYQSQGGPQGHIIYGNNNTIYMPPPPAPWEQGNGTGLGMHESILHHNFHSAPVHLQTQPLASYPPHMMCQPRMAQQAMPYYNANSGFGNQQVTNGWD